MWHMVSVISLIDHALTNDLQVTIIESFSHSASSVLFIVLLCYMSDVLAVMQLLRLLALAAWSMNI